MQSTNSKYGSPYLAVCHFHFFFFPLPHIIITLSTTVAIKFNSHSHILKIAASWLVTRELLLREMCFNGSYLSFWELNSFIKQFIRIISSIKAAWSCSSCLISAVTCGGTLYPCWGLNQEDPVKTENKTYPLYFSVSVLKKGPSSEIQELRAVRQH